MTGPISAPSESHPLRAALEELDGPMNDWTVLSEARDPFRLDTPANHRDAAWLRDAFEQRSLPRPIHIRRVHYRVFGHPKPDGKEYDGTDWKWLSEKVVKAARWLNYIPWDWIKDERNAAPELFQRTLHDPKPGVVLTSPGFAILLPDADDLKPRANLPGFIGAQQPYHLVLVGEKSSLRDDLVAIANKYEADWYLPDGEISDTHIEHMARSGVADPRPLVLIYFADSDPSGHQMIVSVTRKLQAFAYLAGYQGLQFIAHRALLTLDQVRSYDLLPQPLSPKEQRASRWREAYGIEQTEVDALMDKDPDAKPAAKVSAGSRQQVREQSTRPASQRRPVFVVETSNWHVREDDSTCRTRHCHIVAGDQGRRRPDRTFTDVANVFDNLDAHSDIVRRDAFAKSLASGQQIPLVWMQKADDPRCYVGNVVEATETDEGLAIKGRFDLDTEFGKSAYRNTKGRRVSGLSIPRHVCDFHPIFAASAGRHVPFGVIGVITPPGVRRRPCLWVELARGDDC